MHVWLLFVCLVFLAQMSQKLIAKTNEVFHFRHKSGISDKIYIEGYEKFQQKVKLPPVGIELTTPTIYGLEGRCLLYSAAQTC